jgi:hypothetical protein
LWTGGAVWWEFYQRLLRSAEALDRGADAVLTVLGQPCSSSRGTVDKLGERNMGGRNRFGVGGLGARDVPPPSLMPTLTTTSVPAQWDGVERGDFWVKLIKPQTRVHPRKYGGQRQGPGGGGSAGEWLWVCGLQEPGPEERRVGLVHGAAPGRVRGLIAILAARGLRVRYRCRGPGHFWKSACPPRAAARWCRLKRQLPGLSVFRGHYRRQQGSDKFSLVLYFKPLGGSTMHLSLPPAFRPLGDIWRFSGSIDFS